MAYSNVHCYRQGSAGLFIQHVPLLVFHPRHLQTLQGS